MGDGGVDAGLGFDRLVGWEVLDPWRFVVARLFLRAVAHGGLLSGDDGGDPIGAAA